VVCKIKKMKTLIQTASGIQAFFRERNWRFCFIGGIALQRWGRPRLTVDIDICLLTGFREEDKYIKILLSHFLTRIDDAERFALKNRVLLLKSKEGIGIDIVVAGLPFEEKMMERASEFEFLPGIKLVTCSAEDLIIMKSFADRPQDWVDVESILKRFIGRLDISYIKKNLRPLCKIKEDPSISTRFDNLLKRYQK